MLVEKPSVWATIFSVNLTVQGKIMVKSFQTLSLRGYTLPIQSSTCSQVRVLDD